MSQMLTIKEVEARTGFSHMWVRNLVLRGTFKGAVKDGKGNWKIPETEVSRYQEYRKAQEELKASFNK